MLALSLAISLSGSFLGQDPWPLTTAESSNYEKTSSYADVVGFIDRLQDLGAPIRVLTIGSSTLGKPIPLVICHRNPAISPTEAKARQLPVVYIQANIHAGEVEGKESVLRLLREWGQNPKDPVLDRLVLVVQPIYNSDGNDKWGTNLQNRGHQDGPDPVGERANGQGLDLNRDCMKAESPEMNAVLKHVYGQWNPDVVMDLHTTNGTRHGFVLTYSPGLNPTCDAEVMKFTRDELLPKMRREAKKQKGWEFFDYGDASNRNNAWTFQTFACDPRYVTNYASIRNRISILSEAASFQPFELRVQTTHWFVKSLLAEIARQDKRVFQMIRRADQRTTDAGRSGKAEIGVRFDFDNRGKEPVLLEVERKPSEIDHRKAPTEYRTLEMTIVDRFKPTRKAKLPYAYLYAANASLTDLLRRHGIVVEELRAPYSASCEAFKISKASQASAAFQGKRLITLEGAFEARTVRFVAGDCLVRTAQPLGLLAFHLLEPESMDGAAAWGFVKDRFEVGEDFSILKSTITVQAATRQVVDAVKNL